MSFPEEISELLNAGFFKSLRLKKTDNDHRKDVGTYECHDLFSFEYIVEKSTYPPWHHGVKF